MIRTLYVTVVMTVVTLALLPFQLAGILLGNNLKRIVPLLFHRAACAVIGIRITQVGARTRDVVAADFAFQFARLADPAVNSPVASSFAQVAGFSDFTKRLADKRKADPAFSKLPQRRQYEEAGGIAGVIARSEGSWDEATRTLTYVSEQVHGERRIVYREIMQAVDENSRLYRHLMPTPDGGEHEQIRIVYRRRGA